MAVKTRKAVAVPTKKELAKLLTAWRNGRITKSAIDATLGHGSRKGKFIDAQWRSRLGVATNGLTREVTSLR